MPTKSNTERVYEAIERFGAEGVLRSDLLLRETGISPGSTDSALSHLRDRCLVRCEGVKGQPGRWFVTGLEAQFGRHTPLMPRSDADGANAKRKTARRAPAAKVIVEQRPIEVVVCAGFPGYNARLQCAPGERPFGAGFAALGPGRYL